MLLVLVAQNTNARMVPAFFENLGRPNGEKFCNTAVLPISSYRNRGRSQSDRGGRCEQNFVL